MQNYRYVPGIVTVAQQIRGGVIGNVEELHADFFIGAHFGGFRDAMEFPLILDMSIHTFDASRYISGADPVSVYCHSFNPKRSWYKGDASASAIFEMKTPEGDPIVFNYRGSWCAEGLGTPWNGNWRIVGSRGTITWDGAGTIKVASIKPDGKHSFISEMVESSHPETTLALSGHGGLMQGYLASQAAGKPPVTVCTDNIKSLAMVLAAVESGKAGAKVGVKW
jgi:predicted dehydrogenase